MKKVYKLSIMLCCVFIALSGCQNKANAKKDQELKNGQAKLAALATQDLEEVTQVVAKKQAELLRARQAESGPISYIEIFSNTVVMGDSIAAGLVEYRLLNDIQVVSARGRNVDTIDEDIQKVIALAPTTIFMQYGINDLTYFRQNTPLFIEKYKGVILQLQAALPKTKIYVNSLIPIMQNAIERTPGYVAWPNFNEALVKMCAELKVGYIDNTSTIQVNQIPYNADGIHPVYDYFPLWLEKMAEVAKL